MITAIALLQSDLGNVVPWLLLYIGPEVILPITSALAAIAGVLLMFWNKVIGLARGAWRIVFGRSSSTE